MGKKLPCYLRTYRRRAGLTQKELAVLLGLGHDTAISKLERRTRQPNLKIAFGCQVIFKVPAEVIFPGVLEAIKQEIAGRIDQQQLFISVAGKDRPQQQQRQ